MIFERFFFPQVFELDLFLYVLIKFQMIITRQQYLNIYIFDKKLNFDDVAEIVDRLMEEITDIERYMKKISIQISIWFSVFQIKKYIIDFFL